MRGRALPLIAGRFDTIVIADLPVRKRENTEPAKGIRRLNVGNRISIRKKKW